MTTTLFIVTCVVFVTGAVCSPVAEATSSLDRRQLSSVGYPQPWPRRYMRLLADPYNADYSTEDSAPVKRSGNGAWVWMPAQGYVSVSRNQQSSGGDVNSKHGRIMRYGK